MSYYTVELWNGQVPLENVKAVLDCAHADLFKKKGISFESSQMNLSEYRDKINNGKCFIATDKGKVVGTLSICFESGRVFDFVENVARVRFVAVTPEYQKQHIASGLMTEAIQWIDQNNFSTALVSTRTDNTNAIYLYERFGFIKEYIYPCNDYFCVRLIRRKKSVAEFLRIKVRYYKSKVINVNMRKLIGKH